MLMTPTEVDRKVQDLSGARGTFETHWQEVTDFILPRKNDITTRRFPGEKRNIQVLDNTAMFSNELLAAAMHTMLTNPNTMWFELTTGDKEIDDRDDVRVWLQDTQNRIFNVLVNSNFNTEVHEVYLDLGAIGTSPMVINEDPRSVVLFSTKPIKDVFIDENNNGMVDEVYQVFNWNWKKVIQQFGEKGTPEKVIKARKGNENTLFRIIHAIYPKRIDKPTKSPMQFHSQWVFHQDLANILVGGFREFPYVVPRWSKVSSEKYGRSPGMTALPEIKTLNKMVETTLKGAQKVTDPPLMVPDDGFITNVRTRPGSLNFFRAGSQDRITPIFNDTRIDFGFQAMSERRQRVREAFFVDQLRLPAGPQKTATEVEQLSEEQLRLLGPFLARQQNEFLRPLIDRVFAIMDRRGMFLEAPEILAGRRLDVNYASVIGRSQRVAQSRNIIRTMEQIGVIGSVMPEVFDNIDGDKAARGITKLNSFPQDMLRNKTEIAQIREQRAEAQADAEKREQQRETADNVSKISAARQAQGV